MGRRGKTLGKTAEGRGKAGVGQDDTENTPRPSAEPRELSRIQGHLPRGLAGACVLLPHSCEATASCWHVRVLTRTPPSLRNWVPAPCNQPQEPPHWEWTPFRKSELLSAFWTLAPPQMTLITAHSTSLLWSFCFSLQRTLPAPPGTTGK